MISNQSVWRAKKYGKQVTNNGFRHQFHINIRETAIRGRQSVRVRVRATPFLLLLYQTLFILDISLSQCLPRHPVFCSLYPVSSCHSLDIVKPSFLRSSNNFAVRSMTSVYVFWCPPYGSLRLSVVESWFCISLSLISPSLVLCSNIFPTSLTSFEIKTAKRRLLR